MSDCLLRQCIVIIFICFIIYVEKLYATDIRVISDIQQLKFRKLGLANKIDPINLTEEQMEQFKIWPHGVITYFIDDLSFDKVLRDRIRAFLEETGIQTNLQFVELPVSPENDDTRWVFFINRRSQLECSDYTTANFTNKGVQKVVVGYDCLGATTGGFAAIILVLVGIPPQHNAPNRDSYIQIRKANIMPDKIQFFDMLSNDDWLFKSLPYDFASVGHYNYYKYTVNGFSTVKPLVMVNFPMGEAKEFSLIDILKIRMLYYHTFQMKILSMSGYCSKLFKPGKKFGEFKQDEEDTFDKVTVVKVNDAPANTLSEETSDYDIIDKPVKNKGAKLSKLKLTGLKGVIEQTYDYDTDMDEKSLKIKEIRPDNS